MECNIDDLPDVLLEYILSLIPPYKDLQGCMFVSKRWYHITRNVLQHNETHFYKSVAFGTLLWSSWPPLNWIPTIGKRHSHSACTYENSMYVFGGCTATCTTFNDLWRLDLDTRKWVRPITMGSYPSPKASATMVYYKKSFILFGGWSQPSPYPLHQQWKLFNELHLYLIESNKWVAINASAAPPPISAHSASVHKNYMIVFGGISNTYRSNDIWCLNLDSYVWHRQATSAIKPQPRYGQSQIELGDNHLLILGGCMGSDIPMNDAWLLKMEGATWTWRKVNLKNTECAPTRIWCHQACKVNILNYEYWKKKHSNKCRYPDSTNLFRKSPRTPQEFLRIQELLRSSWGLPKGVYAIWVGNYVIVLSISKRQIKAGDPNVAANRATCQRSSLPRVSENAPLHERQKNVPNIDKDVNVNGRHGSFARATTQNGHAATQSPSFKKALPLCNDNVLSMAAFRDEPLRNGTNSNRQRQLESLRRMEERIRNRKTQPKAPKRSSNSLSIFVLDITDILRDDCSATWKPLKQSNQSGPDERILYSLVAGRGELIVFGGIRKEPGSIQGHPDNDESEVYNDLHFINPPRYVI